MVSWPTGVEGNLKYPFSIAATPLCMRGRYSYFLNSSTFSRSGLYNAEC